MAFTTQKPKHKKKKKIIRKYLKCSLCQAGVSDMSFIDVYKLKKFISRRGKIISRFKTGNCSKHQRVVTIAVKRARQMSLLPFILKD